MRETEGWERIIKETTFTSMSAQGRFARFWEENSWWPLIARRIGAAATPVQPAPAGYTGLPAASAASAWDSAGAWSDAHSASADYYPPVAPVAKTKPCANCGAQGHVWWDCTPVTGWPLDERLATQLRALQAKKGAPAAKGSTDKGKGKGGAGKGKGGKPWGKGKDKGKEKGKNKGGKGPQGEGKGREGDGADDGRRVRPRNQ